MNIIHKSIECSNATTIALIPIAATGWDFYCWDCLEENISKNFQELSAHFLMLAINGILHLYMPMDYFFVYGKVEWRLSKISSIALYLAGIFSGYFHRYGHYP